MTTQTRIRIFSNGTEYMAFLERNCECCVKGWNGESQYSRCQIENALFAACIGDGNIKRALAERMGYFAAHDEKGLGPFTWDCPERLAESAPRKRPVRAVSELQGALL